MDSKAENVFLYFYIPLGTRNMFLIFYYHTNTIQLNVFFMNPTILKCQDVKLGSLPRSSDTFAIHFKCINSCFLGSCRRCMARERYQLENLPACNVTLFDTPFLIFVKKFVLLKVDE